VLLLITKSRAFITKNNKTRIFEIKINQMYASRNFDFGSTIKATMQDGEIKRKGSPFKWQNWLVGFFVWTIIGLSFASRTYLSYVQSGTATEWQHVYSAYMIDFYLWGAVSPFIFWLSRRFPVERDRLLSRIIFHFFVALGLNFIVMTAACPTLWYLGYPNLNVYPTLGALLKFTLTSHVMLHQSLLVYCGTLIAGHALEYYRQLQEGKTRAAELTSQLAQAQLAALKMQIHPHFLFNTLNSIAALLHKDVETADRMIARLSDFLRLTLNSSETSVVRLEQELEFLKTYLEIEKIRFQHRLQVNLKIEPDALDAKLPNLILQPLIENAIRHGIARQTSVGHLNVEARRDADRLLIKIEDNGPGLNGSKNGKRKSGDGVGLSNTRARLEQFYESDFQFEIKNKPNENGTVVNLNVPYLN
jgi:two-component system LytT family sensor kinase